VRKSMTVLRPGGLVRGYRWPAGSAIRRLIWRPLLAAQVFRADQRGSARGRETKAGGTRYSFMFMPGPAVTSFGARRITALVGTRCDPSGRRPAPSELRRKLSQLGEKLCSVSGHGPKRQRSSSNHGGRLAHHVSPPKRDQAGTIARGSGGWEDRQSAIQAGRRQTNNMLSLGGKVTGD